MPKPRKKFLPVYFLKMADRLKKGISRDQIIREMSKKHGFSSSTIKTYLSLQIVLNMHYFLQ